MLKTTGVIHANNARHSIAREIESIGALIPPMWDLRNFVAVNPFQGLSGARITEAARKVNDGLGASFLPPTAYYQERWRQGDFTTADLDGPARRAGMEVSRLLEILKGKIAPPCRWRALRATFAERIDRAHGTDWDSFMVRSAARWCADHAIHGQGDSGMFAAWLESCRHDISFEIRGLDRKSTRLNSSHIPLSRMPSSA